MSDDRKNKRKSQRQERIGEPHRIIFGDIILDRFGKEHDLIAIGPAIETDQRFSVGNTALELKER